MNEALQSLLGAECRDLSASTVTNLKMVWEAEFQEWNSRSLEGKEYVYVWADGVHFNIRLEEDRQCILVLMGVTKDGTKELIAIQDGFRERAVDANCFGSESDEPPRGTSKRRVSASTLVLINVTAEERNGL